VIEAASPAIEDSAMPKGSKVDRVYRALLKEGKSKGSAARIAQAKTGRSLKTGRPPKGK
jgi:hypothetical protein